MVAISELKIERDGGAGRYAIYVLGTWYGLEGRLEDLILKEECKLCPKEVMEKCIILTDVPERGAFCEVNADAVRQAKFADCPMPQPGELLRIKCEKEGLYYDPIDKVLKPKVVVVATLPEPEPPKRATLAEKVRGVFKF